jgi:succinoglycan biosynthesis transport protein ExoP
VLAASHQNALRLYSLPLRRKLGNGALLGRNPILQNNDNPPDRYSPEGSDRAAGSSPRPAVINPARLVRALWRQRLLVAFPAAICLALAIAYLVTEPRLYTSTARLSINRTASRAAGENPDAGLPSSFLRTQRQKLLSREVLSGALAMAVPNDKDARKIKDVETFKDPDVDRLALMRTWADADSTGKDDVLSVSFQSPVKDEAPIIANAIVEAFIRFQTQPRHATTQEILDTQRAERAKAQEELNRATAGLAQLEQQYGALSAKIVDNLAMRQLEIVTQQLQAAHLETLRAKGEFEDAAKAFRPDPRLVGPLPPHGDLAGLAATEDEQTLKAQLVQLQAVIQGMNGHYLSEHPAAQGAQARLAQVGTAYADAIERRWKRTQAAEDDLKAQLEKQKDAARQVGFAANQYARLHEDVDRLRKQVDACDGRIHAIELQNSAADLDIDFFDHAVASPQPSHPLIPRTLGFALIVGLGLGCVLGLLRDAMDDRLRSADDIKSALATPVLGLVPQMPAGISPGVAGMKAAMEPAGDVAEAYRSVRTAVSLGAPRDRSKTILITSPTSGDGKTTAAANLASVMAQAGKKVLLIDADLRTPRLHTIFNLKDTRMGLSGLLGGQGTLERTVLSTSVDGLDLLPCGPKPRNPSEVLNSPMFSELLEVMAEQYDHIVVDSPPVMGAADARIIAASCDVTVLVLRAGRSTRKLASLARDGLVSVGANVIGVVVNSVPRGSESHYDRGYGLGRRVASAGAEGEPDTDDPPLEMMLNQGA